MRPQKTYEAIVRVLEDGEWHDLDELAEVSSFPEHWARQLSSEGVVLLTENAGTQKVRLLPGQ